MVVDWHNLAFTIMEQTLRHDRLAHPNPNPLQYSHRLWLALALALALTLTRKDHPFIAPAKLYERIFSSAGDAHLCVTAAMQALPTTAYCLLPTAY